MPGTQATSTLRQGMGCRIFRNFSTIWCVHDTGSGVDGKAMNIGQYKIMDF